MKYGVLALLALAIASACSRDAPRSTPAPVPRPEPPPEHVSFVNRVWAVTASPQVEAGSLRVFLSDGTLVMASENSEPALGRWSQDGEGRLTLTEDGRPYDTDILALTDDSFRIRMHGPGEPVELRLEPAPKEAAARTQDVIHVAGTVHHLPLEGGVWVIRAADGTQYQPLELPAAFRKDGLGVEVRARHRDNVVTTGMAGSTIDVLHIEKRSP